MMDGVYTRRVSSLNDNQIKSAADVLSQALESDPLLLPMVGGDLSLSPYLFRAYIAAAIVDGDAYFAEHAGDVLGVALWFGPGKEFLGSFEQREAGWLSFWSQLSSSAQMWLDNEYMPRLSALYSRSMPPSATKSESYSLSLIGVHPAFQGKGIGSQLMQEGKDRARSQGIPVCLDTNTESNVATYKNWGFQVGGAERLESVWRDIVLTVMTWGPES